MSDPWESRVFQYMAAASATLPDMTAPSAPGSSLSGSSQLFQWSANGTGATEWWLYVGSTTGGKDLYDSHFLGGATSTTVAGLPTDGRRIHVRLFYRASSSDPWQSRDFQYKAND
jgi:hypothetical protein